MRYLSVVAAAAAWLSATSSGLAQVPTEQLAKPPATAQTFSIVSSAGKHGSASIWTAPDGANWSRESLLLRGQVWELDQSVKLGADGMPRALVARGRTPNGDAGETFAITRGDAAWKSQVDAGHAAYKAPAFYVPLIGTNSGGTKLLIEALLKAPDHTLTLLPGGKAHA